jgi:TonB family protein
MSILIRVEPDGRVSDTRIETGSGDTRADADAQRCLTAFGAFPPSRSQGQPIASWQRLRWVGGGLDRSS